MSHVMLKATTKALASPLQSASRLLHNAFHKADALFQGFVGNVLAQASVRYSYRRWPRQMVLSQTSDPGVEQLASTGQAHTDLVRPD